MLLEVTHETDLTYSDVISESVMELRVCPEQATDQHRLSFDLALGPPTQVTGYFDWLDNLVYAFTINGYHDHIRILATSVVEVDRKPVELAELTEPWPVDGLEENYALYDFLQFAGPITDTPALRELADQVQAREGEPLGQVAERIMRLIGDRFEYGKGVTTSSSPIDVALTHRKGVCQDFTQVMIGLCRALGIPARYVSGLVHSDAEAGDAHFVGDSETHSWCEIWAGPRGWVGFDPTNQCGVDAHFVKVAVGRHYGDVPPNKGVYRGTADESIRVQVRSRELRDVPVELAAESLRRLDLPVSELPPSPAEPDAAQQQQAQQQQ